MKLRSGCLMSYAADVGNRSERSMHSNRSVKKDEAHDAPRPLVETSLVGDLRESEARSFWSIPGLGKEPPGFLANETLESLIRVSVLALIHRRTACRRPAEETKGCASESGIMVLKQKTGPRKGASDRCYHVTTPTGSKSPSTTTA